MRLLKPVSHASRFDVRFWLAAGTGIAAIATGGSLWLSLGLGLSPCELCWYQRILMYPLVVVLGVATFEERASVFRTAFPLALGGVAIAAYHSWLQYAATSTRCSFNEVSCAAVQYRIAGLTIPNLSLVAFTIISIALIWVVQQTK